MFAQGGKSEAILDIIGERLDRAPAPILYVGPGKQFLTEQWEPRIVELFEQSKALTAGRSKVETKTRKKVNGVPLRLAHAGSSTALKSDPAALALTDEADELMANVRGQGSPIRLVDRRGDTHPEFVHAITSTPSKGPSDVERDEDTGLEFWKKQDPAELESPIWRLWQEGTQYHWAWRCPHCRGWFIPRFRNLQWPKGCTPTEALEKAYVECPRADADGVLCEGIIEERHKVEMNANGVYVAPGQRISAEGVVEGDPPASTTVSFWVSGLASPFVSFGQRAAEFIEAVRGGKPEDVQAVINAGFGELWAPGGGDAPQWLEVQKIAKGSSYSRGEVPAGVRVLTLAADVQKFGIYWTIRGWGARSTSWLIDHGFLTGATIEREVWAKLADLITTPVQGLPVVLALIDSGYRPGRVDQMPLNRVYEFCRRFQKRVRPAKGSSVSMRTPLHVSKLEVTPIGRLDKYGLELFMLDPNYWKAWVHEKVRWPQDQVGAWHLPENTEDDFCMQIVSEAPVKKPSGRIQWVPRSKQNHYLDCESMQAAAGHFLNVQRIPAQEDNAPPPPAAPRAQPQAIASDIDHPAAAPPPRIPRRGGFLGDRRGYLGRG